MSNVPIQTPCVSLLVPCPLYQVEMDLQVNGGSTKPVNGRTKLTLTLKNVGSTDFDNIGAYIALPLAEGVSKVVGKVSPLRKKGKKKSAYSYGDKHPVYDSSMDELTWEPTIVPAKSTRTYTATLKVNAKKLKALYDGEVPVVYGAFYPIDSPSCVFTTDDVQVGIHHH